MASVAHGAVVSGARHVRFFSSYDAQGQFFFADYLGAYFDSVNSGYTNSFISASRSGGSIQEANEGDGTAGPRTHMVGLPVWGFRTNSVQSWAWWMSDDNNGSFTSNDIRIHLTNAVLIPSRMWDGSAYGNPGGFSSTSTVSPVLTGQIPNNSTTSINSARDRNNTWTNFAEQSGYPYVDLWHGLMFGDRDGVSGWGYDITNGTAKVFGNFGLGHPVAAGHLNIAMEMIRQLAPQLGLVTNIAIASLTWNGVVTSTNRVAITGASKSGNVLQFTWHSDGMPFGWDVPDGTITNDARPAFEVIPSHGSVLRFGFSVSGLPAGTYRVREDGADIWTGTNTELGSFLNLTTNYVDAFWAQRTEVLGRRRDLEGVDRTTLYNTHGAGEAGLYGSDMINFLSNAQAQWDAAKRGDAMIGALDQHFGSVYTNYESRIRAAAIQTNHTFEVTCLDCPSSRSGYAAHAGGGKIAGP